MTATLQAIASRSPLRQARIVAALQSECSKLIGRPLEEIDSNVTFLALGADSLVLLRISQTLKDLFGIKVPFRRLLNDLSTIEGLAAHVDQSMFPERAETGNGQSDSNVAAYTQSTVSSVTADQASAMERIFAQQLKVMSMQIELLRSQAGAAEPSRAAMPVVAEEILQVERVSDSAAGRNGDDSIAEAAARQEPACEDATFEKLVSEIQALTPEQVRIAIDNEREIHQADS